MRGRRRKLRLSGRRGGQGGGDRGGSLVHLIWEEGSLAMGCWVVHGNICFRLGRRLHWIRGLSLTVSPDLGYLLLVVEHM